MRTSRIVAMFVASGATVALGLLALSFALGQGSSQAQDGTMRNCPQPGKWAIAVWGGSDGTAAEQAFATCGAGSVAAAYSLNPQTGSWSRWFAGRSETATLDTLDNMQGVIALGGAGASAAASPGSSPQQDAMHNCPQAGKWAISVWAGADGTDAGQALDNCGTGAVTAAYSLDPQTGGWSRWLASRPEMTTLETLNNMQGVFALRAVAPTTPTATPSPTPSAVSPLCSDPQPAFVTDLQVYQTPSLAEPAARVPFRDSVFGTCLVRVTDRTSDLSPDDTSAGLKNEYSRVQSFNSDGSRLLARGIEGTWYLYDAHTLQPLAELPLEFEPRWDASDPDLIYFTVPDDIQLMSYNVQTAEQTLVHDFADDFPGQPVAYVWTRHEGSPSADSRYWGLIANDQEGAALAFLVYDRQVDQVIAKRDMSSVPEVAEGIDHVTMSPLGNYFIASFDHSCEYGQLGDDAHPCGLMVYDRNLTNGRSLLRVIGHYDPALDAQGREVLVYQDIDTDNISVLDLAVGTVTALWPIDFSHTEIGLHFSGRAFLRRGWALVSTHDGDSGAYTWMDDQVFALELKPGGHVVRLAHTHSLQTKGQEHEYDYWAEPHASVNQDFTRILFTSNWGRSGTAEVEMFLIELPSDWPERLP